MMDAEIKAPHSQWADSLVENIKQMREDYHVREDIFYILGEV